ncbi:hypothetical protein PX554_05635 [Sphingomonas sp. H39-1-10]|uniref:hypothetical protein n=1 Tax=Sphingomonas pollutisoli TaxID=3030829 RepID=UPI0023BA19FC|nr:hypothetical protein [Sphingomonas pollutisoli]MDF0487603.1 hypothetical protein [Sphingomonas pollutisoli]
MSSKGLPVRVAAALPLLLIVACSPQTDVAANNDVDIDAAAERAQSSINAYHPDSALPENDPVAPPPPTDPMPSPTPTPTASVPEGIEEPLSPPAPGTPGGLPDDRTPISEAPAAPESAQGAASVVERYYGLIGERKYKPAWQMWRGGGAGSRLTLADFADSFSPYSEYHANVGAPGRIDAGAGQRYVTVPVQIYARLKQTRKPFYQIGTVTLQRSDVDGGTAAQKVWHIQQVALKPVFKR